MQELTVGQGVENDCDVRSHEGDMCISRSSQVSRTIEEEGAESPESILGRIRVKQYFPGVGIQENCIHDVTAAVVACKRPTQSQVSHQFSTEMDRAMSAHPWLSSLGQLMLPEEGRVSFL